MSDIKNTNKQDEINKMKAKIMYDELIIKYNEIKDIDTEENIIQKIIELNFDENKVKEYYIVQRIYDQLDEEYDRSAFFDEQAIKDMKDKIKELHCDKELIGEWVEENLLNGN